MCLPFVCSDSLVSSSRPVVSPDGPGGLAFSLAAVSSTTATGRGYATSTRSSTAGWTSDVFDENDQLIRAETVALDWLKTAGDDGDIYGFDGSVYRGTGAVGGSVWFGRDARKLQYRLYYEVNGIVFSDGLLRQHDVPADSEVMNPSVPTRRAKASSTTRSSATKAPAPKAPAKARETG